MTVTKTFANDRNLQLLADNDTIYTDGTFYTCQSLFTSSDGLNHASAIPACGTKGNTAAQAYQLMDDWVV
jgi:hypothetical protein